MAETVLMNFMRGDIYRLTTCTNAISGFDDGMLRCKPFKFAYQKEIVLYAHYKKLDYFSTECTYSNEAFRGPIKELIKHLCDVNPEIIENIIRQGDKLELKNQIKIPNRILCEKCGEISSNMLC